MGSCVLPALWFACFWRNWCFPRCVLFVFDEVGASRAAVFENKAFRELGGYSGVTGEGVGGNPAVLAQLAQPKRGVAAEDRRPKGHDLRGLETSHAMSVLRVLPFWPAPPNI